VNLVADLDEFVRLHRPHRGMTPTVGELTPNGHRLELVGLTFERWVTAQGARSTVLALPGLLTENVDHRQQYSDYRLPSVLGQQPRQRANRP